MAHAVVLYPPLAVCLHAMSCGSQGDILLRMRHVGDSGMRTTMFRIGFHTGYAPPSLACVGTLPLTLFCASYSYVPDNVLRFSKEELDVACEDSR